MDRLTQKLANSQLADVFADAAVVSGIKLVSLMLTDVKPDVLRKMGDQIRDREPDVIALLACVNGESGNFYCVCSRSAIEKGAHAGKIIQRIAAVTGGKGGGRQDSAMGGIGKTYMVDEALASLNAVAEEMLGAE